jgi:MFS family permease
VLTPTLANSSSGAVVRTNVAYLLPICLVATLAGFLFGYDTGVISGAIEPLAMKFHLTDLMKGWASGCVLIGCAAGVLLVGPLSDRFGRKMAMLLDSLIFLIVAIGTSIPNDIWTFIAFRFVGGIGIGIASISTPMYIAEITPKHVRGRMVAVNQIAIVAGLAVVYFVNYGIAKVGPGYAGVPQPSSALVATFDNQAKTQNYPSITLLAPERGVFTFALGSAEGVTEKTECMLGLQRTEIGKDGQSRKLKPSPLALATLSNVTDHQSQATIASGALPNIDWKKIQDNPADEGAPVAMILSPAEAWQIHSGWRWMFAMGIVPSFFFVILRLFMPESPRWLIEKKREDEAMKILTKVAGPDFAKSETAAIKAALAEENGTWAEVFSAKMRTPLLIGIALAILQQVTGINVFMYFGTTIFNNMSASTGVDAGMLAQAIIGGSGVLFTVIAIATVDKWGRKPLMLIGTSGMGIALIAMGLMAQRMTDANAASNSMLAFIILYIACFGLSVGPVVWVILSELYPTAIRGRALGLATFFLWMADYAVTQSFPIMDAKDSWFVKNFNHAFPFYVYAAFCVILVLVVAFFVPETKGKSLEEIEHYWEHRKA